MPHSPDMLRLLNACAEHHSGDQAEGEKIVLAILKELEQPSEEMVVAAYVASDSMFIAEFVGPKLKSAFRTMVRAITEPL